MSLFVRLQYWVLLIPPCLQQNAAFIETDQQLAERSHLQRASERATPVLLLLLLARSRAP